MPSPRSASEIFDELKQTKHKIVIDGIECYIVEGDLRLDAGQLLAYAFELAEREQARAGGGSGEQRQPLVGIVDDDGQLIGVNAVVATQHEITDAFTQRLDDGPKNRILELARQRIDADTPCRPISVCAK